MYSAPENIRDNVVKIRLNDREAALLKALNEYTGQQLAVLAREILLEHAQQVLIGQADCAQSNLFDEVQQHARNGH
jgi:hypothetical protein